MTTLMSRTAVSFVLTVYNKRRYLADVLASVAAQDGGFEREVIIVDDGSTDGSREVLESLGPQLPGFRLIAQSNQGPSGGDQSRARSRLDAAGQAARRR